MGIRRDLRRINLLVVHCSGAVNGAWQTVCDINAMHRRKFRRDMSISPHHQPALRHIGYHHVIYTNGALDCGRPLQETGAHVRGHNIRSIGTCLIGTDQFTPAQWNMLARHVRSYQKRFPGLEVVGHRIDGVRLD